MFAAVRTQLPGSHSDRLRPKGPCPPVPIVERSAKRIARSIMKPRPASVSGWCGGGALLVLRAATASGGARGGAVAVFSRGKPLSMIVPADPGGSYDLHTRLIARHIGKWI